jgi:undecaprenyl-diphosphatase
MGIVHVVVLALVQGLTEFLPISSSGHLVLLPHVVNWPDQGLAFDVAVHVGSLIAVVAYFRRDLAVIIVDWFASIRGCRPVGKSRLGWAVIVATIPGGALGYWVNSIASDVLRSPLVIGVATVFFGLLLWWGRPCGHTDA